MNASFDLKPWFAVATPHEDIRKGRLSEAVFAANIWAVAQGTAPDIYLDPEAFFSKTYLTGGLSRILQRVGRSLAGEAEAGDRIFSLQTSFGGGKTHSLVALWHLARHTDKIVKQAILPAELIPTIWSASSTTRERQTRLPAPLVNVAVFTNQTCDPTQGRKTPEGVHTRTLWGELAVQLGGKELYRKIETNDHNRTAPKGLFVEILKQAAPCLILLDELADYCVVAGAVEVGTGTLADQTVSFIQELTEAAAQVPGAAIAATLPASALEVSSSEKGQDILQRLEKRFGRMSADIKPVADEEIYEVVRRRLFETLGDKADHMRVADAYAKLYEQHKNEVTAEASKGTCRERILAAYPFHPMLIDALYLRWGSHPDFQRTRGVLRLLASVVGELWKRRQTDTQSQALIQPCHVKWTTDALNSALTRLWGATYETVVAADVIGEKSNAVALDEDKGGEYPTEKITQGLAASIMLGSFGGKGDQSGYSTKDLKVAVGRPGLNWNYCDGAMLSLEENGFYLHTASAGSLGKRYWFGTKPNLNKLIVTYRQQFSAQDVDPDIVDKLQEQTKSISADIGTWRLIVSPAGDLPEQKALTLLIMPPTCPYSEDFKESALIASPAQKRILELSQKCGRKERHYKNTLLFLLPSTRGLNRLRSGFREVAVLEAVKRDYSSQLDDEQKDDLKKRLEAAEKSLGELTGTAYTHVARVEGQQLTAVQLASSKANIIEHLRAAWKQLVEEEEWILRKVGTVTLQNVGLIPDKGGSRVKDAIEAFLRYTDKPVIASRDAVLAGLAQACKERLIGIGRGPSLSNLQRKWCGEEVMLDPNEEGLWILPPFSPEAEPQKPGTPPGTGGTQPPGKGPIIDVVPPGHPPGKPPVDVTARPVKKIVVSGSVPLESWSDLFRCFVNPAARLNPKKLGLGVEIELVFGDDQNVKADDAAVKGMKEAARQLGLEMDVEN
jgi:hypothetical protein